jgi:hypothetical protein
MLLNPGSRNDVHNNLCSDYIHQNFRKCQESISIRFLLNEQEGNILID